MEALLDKNRRVPNHKNRVDARIEKRVCEMAVENPALGQARVSNEMRKEGLCISPGGVCVPCGYAMNYKASSCV